MQSSPPLQVEHLSSQGHIAAAAKASTAYFLLGSPHLLPPIQSRSHSKRKRSMAALGSKLAQLQSKACEATRFAARHGCAYHKTLMERNKRYVVDPPTIEKCQDLSNQLFYTRLASLPGRYESFWKEIDDAKLLLKNRKNLKVEDAGVAALFGIELYAWFCVGEIIGRGFTLTGYHV